MFSFEEFSKKAKLHLASTFLAASVLFTGHSLMRGVIKYDSETPRALSPVRTLSAAIAKAQTKNPFKILLQERDLYSLLTPEGYFEMEYLPSKSPRMITAKDISARQALAKSLLTDYGVDRVINLDGYFMNQTTNLELDTIAGMYAGTVIVIKNEKHLRLLGKYNFFEKPHMRQVVLANSDSDSNGVITKKESSRLFQRTINSEIPKGLNARLYYRR